MVNIAVMGYGTVGSGVVEVINTNGDVINQRAADEINIKYVLPEKNLREIFPEIRSRKKLFMMWM